MFEKLPFNDL